MPDQPFALQSVDPQPPGTVPNVTVVNSQGQTKPFSTRELAGALLEGGLDGPAALNRARQFSTILAASGVPAVSTDAIRTSIGEMTTSSSPDLGKIVSTLQQQPQLLVDRGPKLGPAPPHAPTPKPTPPHAAPHALPPHTPVPVPTPTPAPPTPEFPDPNYDWEWVMGAGGTWGVVPRPKKTPTPPTAAPPTPPTPPTPTPPTPPPPPTPPGWTIEIGPGGVIILRPPATPPTPPTPPTPTPTPPHPQPTFAAFSPSTPTQRLINAGKKGKYELKYTQKSEPPKAPTLTVTYTDENGVQQQTQLAPGDDITVTGENVTISSPSSGSYGGAGVQVIPAGP